MKKQVGKIKGFPEDIDLQIKKPDNESSEEENSYIAEIAEYLESPYAETEIDSREKADIVPIPRQQHLTPAKQVSSPYLKKRPASSRGFMKSPSLNSLSTNEDIAYITQITSNEAVKSIYSLVSYKFPCSINTTADLAEKDKAEIQAFFENKKNEFRNMLKRELNTRPYTPHELSTKQKVRKRNLFHKNKMQEINKNHLVSEIKRIKKSKNLKEQNLHSRLQSQLEKALFRAERAKLNEERKKTKEIQQVQKFEKELIIENIKNFYRDRIDLFKQEINKQKKTNRAEETERKKVSYT